MENADGRDEALETAKAELKTKGRKGIVVRLGLGEDEHTFIFELLNRAKMDSLTRALAGAKDKKTGDVKVKQALDILVTAAKFQCLYGAEHFDEIAQQYPQALCGEVMDELMDLAKGAPKIEML